MQSFRPFEPGSYTFEQPISKVILKEKYLGHGEFYRDDIIERLVENGCYKENSHLILNENELKSLFDYFVPGGRISGNLGRTDCERNSLVNCTSVPEMEDSLEGIMKNFETTAKLLQSGAGVGTNFSSLRPRGMTIKGIPGAVSSGPVSFMKVGDALCKTIRGAGLRRGAQISVLSSNHPDCSEEFLTCKSNGIDALTQYNISVGFEASFMKKLREVLEEGSEDTKFMTRFPIDEEVPVKFTREIDIKEFWETFLRESYENSEPGALFLDTANEYNPLKNYEDIVVANP
jgi:ribonucleoside-diphosphate reductase alpha chain